MDRKTRQKISKKTENLNHAIDQLDLTDIYKTLPNNTEYTFFSSVRGQFSRIEHILGYKTNLNNFKRTEIIQSMFFGHME